MKTGPSNGQICSRCAVDLPVPFIACGLCGWRAVVASYQAPGKSSADLTALQWYNVCRFWPTIARRCGRRLADVGPHNPLHASSRIGPLLRLRCRRSILRRVAIQVEGERLS